MLTVHHLQVSQSDRVVFLCEELGIQYELKIHKRDPVLSPQSIKDLHPIGAAPIIQDGDLTLAETAAIVEYIINIYGDGRLAIKPGQKEYADYLYWFHYANGSLVPGLMRLLAMKSVGGNPESDMYKFYVGRADSLTRQVDDRLKDNKYLAGDEFTAADIMTIFPFTTGRYFISTDLSAYPNILAWIKHVTERPAYQKYHQKADPELKIPVDGPPPPHFTTMLNKA
ncbi:hypothetical protein MBLNU457_7244t1 [Dothideomycetes sp. NU457]